MNLPATSWARGIKLRARRLPGVGGWVQRDHPNLSGYLFIAPNMLGFLIFTGLAVVASLVLAFYDWDLLLGANFVGLANFGELFTEDDVFRSAFLNTVYFVVASVPLSVVAGLVTALLTAQSLRGMSLFRAIFLLPWITTTVAVSLVWKWMYLPKVGVVNQIIGALNIPGPAWLTDKTWAMPAIILMSVWKNFGFNTVLFLAGLQGIPQHLYDAASVDGATAWQRFRHVTVPMLSPTTFFVVIISIIGSFQVFDQALIMTAGGPGTSTTTLVLYVYQVGFQSYHMGMASAVAWVLTACVFVFTAVMFWAQRRWVTYE